MVIIQEIDFANRLVVTADQRSFPIADLFDRHGVSTTDSRRAIMGIAGAPGRWLTFTLQPFDKGRLQ